MVMKMTTNDTTMDPSFAGNGLGRRPREHRVTPLRHRLDERGTEFTVLKTKLSAGLPIIFPLYLLHNTNTDPEVQHLFGSNTFPAYL